MFMSVWRMRRKELEKSRRVVLIMGKHAPEHITYWHLTHGLHVCARMHKQKWIMGYNAPKHTLKLMIYKYIYDDFVALWKHRFT